MPRHESGTVDPAVSSRRATANDAGARPLPPPTDSRPRDWSKLGRRVLAEALRRATDELVKRSAPKAPASVVPRSSPEERS